MAAQPSRLGPNAEMRAQFFNRLLSSGLALHRARLELHLRSALFHRWWIASCNETATLVPGVIDLISRLSSAAVYGKCPLMENDVTRLYPSLIGGASRTHA